MKLFEVVMGKGGKLLVLAENKEQVARHFKMGDHAATKRVTESTDLNSNIDLDLTGLMKRKLASCPSGTPGQDPRADNSGVKRVTVDTEYGRLSFNVRTKLSAATTGSNPPAHASADNLALWIEGAKSYGGLTALIDQKLQSLRSEISHLEDQLVHFHTKNVKGKTYWYFVENSIWTYKGRDDPRGLLKKKIASEKIHVKFVENAMRSCVVKRLGEHLVIDMAKFHETVAKAKPGGIILVTDIIKKEQKA